MMALLFIKTFKGFEMTKLFNVLSFLALGIALGYLFATALLGV